MWFNYPYIVMVKGNLELIIYSFEADQFYYEVMNLPIIEKTSSVYYIERNDEEFVDLLFDAGEFFILGRLFLEGNNNFSFRIEFNE